MLKFWGKLVFIVYVLCVCFSGMGMLVNFDDIEAKAAVEPVASILSNGIYYIRNQKSGLYLDVANAGTTDGSLLMQYYYNGSDNQRFKVTKINDYYEISPMHAQDKRLDISNASTDNEAALQLYSSNGTNAQKFSIESTGNGDNSFKILTGCTDYNKCITVKHASTEPIEVFQYGYGNDGNSDNDHWYFEDVTLNEKHSVIIYNGSINYYDFKVPDDGFYVAETLPSNGPDNIVTRIAVEGLKSGETLVRSYNGVGGHTMFTFSGQGGQELRFAVTATTPSLAGFYFQIRRQQATLVAFDYGANNINTLPDLTTPSNVLASMYSCVSYQSNDTNIYKKDNRDFPLVNSEIFFFTGHGTGISVANGNGTDYTASNLPQMNNTRVAVWSSCSSADKSTGTSMTLESVNKGALSAIGFAETVQVDSAKKFTDALFTQLSQGNTLADAATQAATQVLWPWDAARNFVIEGDSAVTINDASFVKSDKGYETTTATINTTMLSDTNSFESVILNKNKTRYYKKINGCLTNQFIDVEEGVTMSSSPNISLDEERILPINYNSNYVLGKSDIKIEEHLVYIYENNAYTPVLLEYINKDNGHYIYQDVICTNLHTGELLDYSLINGV